MEQDAFLRAFLLGLPSDRVMRGHAGVRLTVYNNIGEISLEARKILVRIIIFFNIIK